MAFINLTSEKKRFLNVSAAEVILLNPSVYSCLFNSKLLQPYNRHPALNQLRRNPFSSTVLLFLNATIAWQGDLKIYFPLHVLVCGPFVLPAFLCFVYRFAAPAVMLKTREDLERRMGRGR